MQTEQQLEPRDAILQFNPFLGGNGVLRAKGRLKYAPIPWIQKHPIIRDIKDHVIQLIVKTLTLTAVNTWERSLSERTCNRHF